MIASRDQKILSRHPRRVGLTIVVLMPFLSGCFGNSGANAPPKKATSAKKLVDEIPARVLNDLLKAHTRGVAHMERYEYSEAVPYFRKVHNLAPGWIPGSINLAIALFNDAGLKAAQAKKKEAKDQAEDEADDIAKYKEPLGLFAEVLDRDPLNLHAHFCRGIIYREVGRMEQAHDDFQVVAEKDPDDGHAWAYLGETFTVAGPGDGLKTAKPENAKELIEIYTRSFKNGPYVSATIYRLQRAYKMAEIHVQNQLDELKKAKGDPAKAAELRDQMRKLREQQDEMVKLWDKLNPARTSGAPGDSFGPSYGDDSKYALVIDPLPKEKSPASTVRSPRFEGPDPIRVKLPEGTRWAKESDYVGKLEVFKRARNRFGAGLAAFDANGDGRSDLYLCAAVVGEQGVRDALLINVADYQFEEKALDFGLPPDRASLGVAAGDFDADRLVDLFVTGVGDNRLFHNTGKTFKDVTKSSGISGPPALSLTARWLDLDQDGDIDLYVINYTDAANADSAFTDKPPVGVANSAYRNDGKPAPTGSPADGWAPLATVSPPETSKSGLSIKLTPWPDAEALSGGTLPHTGIAAFDLDRDRDLDLVLSADGAPLSAVLNDRVGRFRSLTLENLNINEPISGLLTIDINQDGQGDLVVVSGSGRVSPWINSSRVHQGEIELSFKRFPTNAEFWRTAIAADLDLDSWTDLVGFPFGADRAVPAWARNEGNRFSAQPIPLRPNPEINIEESLIAVSYIDLVGDLLPDLLVWHSGGPPRIGRNTGNGRHWLALGLAGRWKSDRGKDRMRTNSHALGTQFTIDTDEVHSSYIHSTNDSSPGQSVAGVVLGLGSADRVSVLRLRWPDGVIQSEMNIPADQNYALSEFNRKVDSCPVLFTWDGEKFACAGDFLGAGVLGYLMAPGVVSSPDRDEAMRIPSRLIKEVHGMIRMAIAEPMDETTYLDQLALDVVDHPVDVSFAADERFATGSSLPTGRLFAWRKSVEYVHAQDMKGIDLTETLRHFDNRTADGFRILTGMRGISEEHGIVLDFGDQVASFGPSDRLFLCTPGWVEYSKPVANYAAATAGIALATPVLERLRDDGSWELLEAHPGHPAGTPKMSVIELTGKLSGPRCVLRMRTNLECYWDQAFIAQVDANAPLRVTSLPVAGAELGYRGYMREVSSDGKPPLLYDYDLIEPAPMTRLKGTYTRYGDVSPLLQADDDHLCVFGPGEEVRVEFNVQSLPELPKGWVRDYVLRSVGYCKDADLFSVTGDDVGPLPWKGMKAFPMKPSGERPLDDAYKAYLREYQTRRAESR